MFFISWMPEYWFLQPLALEKEMVIDCMFLFISIISSCFFFVLKYLHVRINIYVFVRLVPYLDRQERISRSYRRQYKWVPHLSSLTLNGSNIWPDFVFFFLQNHLKVSLFADENAYSFVLYSKIMRVTTYLWHKHLSQVNHYMLYSPILTFVNLHFLDVIYI